MTEAAPIPGSVRHPNSLCWIMKSMQQHWNVAFGLMLNAKRRVEDCTHIMMEQCEMWYKYGQGLQESVHPASLAFVSKKLKESGNTP